MLQHVKTINPVTCFSSQKKEKKKKGHQDNSDNSMSSCDCGFLFKQDHFPGTFGDLTPKEISST